MPNWTVPSTQALMPDDHLLFNGKKLYWKSRRSPNAPASHYNKYVWSYAVSGLKKNNPYLSKLIAAGRTDVKAGTDYTDAKHQSLSRAGPIPAATYYLPINKTMKFEKSGGGWGVGGWSIYPLNAAVRNLGFVEGKFEMDLPWVRSGFFLHEDGGRDGTAGCIGLTKQGIKNLKGYLQRYATDGHSQIMIYVDYSAKEP